MKYEIYQVSPSRDAASCELVAFGVTRSVAKVIAYALAEELGGTFEVWGWSWNLAPRLIHTIRNHEKN